MSAVEASTDIGGLRVLGVEDEPLVAMLLEKMLVDLGCVVVGIVGSVSEALEMIEDAPAMDAAVLDINVAGKMVFPVADALIERSIPFVFATAYGRAGLTVRYEGVPTLDKPFTEAALAAALAASSGRRPAPGAV